MVISAVVVSHEQLNSTYKKETDSNVKERILLVRRVRFDGLEASKVAEKELNRTRWWTYKWLKRFDEDRFHGLKDQPRSGRPPKISEKRMYRIKTKFDRKPKGIGSQTGNGSDIQKDRCQVS